MDYPSFIEDTTYISMDASASENEQLRAMLSNLTRIHLLTASRFENFDDLIHEYLLSGIEVFGLETGIVSRIVGNSYTVCDVISPLDVLEKGQEFGLEDTYCREVIKSQQVLGFPQVGALDYMRCHPVYENLKLESYLSAPIFVADELFGTLNFTSVSMRESGFSTHERNLIVLMANAIGAFILLRNKEDHLLALNQKMKRFVGYVAHDLRNPLGTIIGLAKMATKPNASPERIQQIAQKIARPAENALEFVNTILENAALSTGKIALSKTQVDAKQLIEDAQDAVEHFAAESNITITLDAPDHTALLCDKHRLHQTLTNLLINAIKYSPENSLIQCSVTPLGEGGTRIDIKNPTSPEIQQGRKLDGQVYGSVGFGLDIVQEVLKAHDSSLIIDESPGTFIASFTLPINQ